VPAGRGSALKGLVMSYRYYGLLAAFAASVSLLLSGCGSDRAASGPADTVTGQPSQTAARKADVDNSDATLWTVLGLAKRRSQMETGPQTGNTVSPELWQAAHDTLQFAGIESEDSVTGLVVTKWYSPPGQPNERLKVSVFILSRALRSDSIALTIDRQEQSPAGGWQKTTVARDVVDGLDSAILLRARQIHAERYRDKFNGAAG
jgi:hypothetical protein